MTLCKASESGFRLVSEGWFQTVSNWFQIGFRGHRFVRTCGSNCAWTCRKGGFVSKFTRKMPDASPGAIVLCEPAQSKCTCTFHKSHFVWKFTGKMPNVTDTTSIEHRALTPTVRTAQCGHTVGGKNEAKLSLNEKENFEHVLFQE